ncbi:hypothetical protein NP233_g2318 [Leucocoprinus birnbaumii]|uniref:Uncharacterized protein n=1 Tax=Leucocoprinus birnbaumii TaxID=56174 RepID=A0AAD5W1K4_9AGAR|nr:hypothetical protein NP233_g2318 [Leucocoprinus birnbaumii]
MPQGIDTSETEYQGPYCKLLFLLFPPEGFIDIEPQCLETNTDGVVDHALGFQVNFHNRPFLVLEIKAPSVLNTESGRKLADRQLRSRLSHVARDAGLNELYEISAVGTKVCFYKYDKGARESITPKPILSGEGSLMAGYTTPMEWWECDILEPEGERRLRSLANHIKDKCAHLSQA